MIAERVNALIFYRIKLFNFLSPKSDQDQLLGQFRFLGNCPPTPSLS